jgi:hypothetical protein
MGIHESYMVSKFANLNLSMCNIETGCSHSEPRASHSRVSSNYKGAWRYSPGRFPSSQWSECATLFLLNEPQGSPAKIKLVEATNHEQGTRHALLKWVWHTHIQRLVMEACEAILHSASKVEIPDMSKV